MFRMQIGLAKTLSEAIAFKWMNEVFERVLGFYSFIVDSVRTMLRLGVSDLA
jgi:hypothetical protein